MSGKRPSDEAAEMLLIVALKIQIAVCFLSTVYHVHFFVVVEIIGPKSFFTTHVLQPLMQPLVSVI